MKVLIVSDNFQPEIGGIQTFTVELCKHLAETVEVEELSAIVFNKGKVKASDFGFHLYQFNEGGKIARGFRLLREIRKFADYDIVHSTTLLPSGFWVVLKNSLSLNWKNCVTCYGLDALLNYKRWDTRKMVEFVFKKADRIIPFSRSTKNEILSTYGIDGENFKVVYPGISLPPMNDGKSSPTILYKSLNLNPEDFIVLFVGRLVKRKGVEDLIKAISFIKNKQVKLVIVGDGPEREVLQHLARKLGIYDRVRFVGEVVHEHVFLYYKIADIFCMPSIYIKKTGNIEGLGIALLEAQSFEVPVIGTRSGGIPEAIENGKTGFLVDEKSPTDICDYILRLKTDRKLYCKMKRNARQFVSDKFSWDKCIQRHLSVYHDFLSGSS